MNKTLRLYIAIGMLLYASPVVQAQIPASELLEWTRQHLDNGDCEKARATYELYKDKVPAGNAEVEQRIDECVSPKEKPTTPALASTSKGLTFTVSDVTFKMIFVKGGTFLMGSNSGKDDEKPVHTVTVSDFYMGEFEVTQALWQEVMGTTHSVGLKKANELGLYDMSGNVWEWCEDWDGNYGSSSQTNPKGPSSGLHSVLRGGCWSFDAPYCRVAYRGYDTPSGRFVSGGFRLALVRR